MRVTEVTFGQVSKKFSQLDQWHKSRGDLDDVSVVELVLQGDDLPHEAQGT